MSREIHAVAQDMLLDIERQKHVQGGLACFAILSKTQPPQMAIHVCFCVFFVVCQVNLMRRNNVPVFFPCIFLHFHDLGLSQVILFHC